MTEFYLLVGAGVSIIWERIIEVLFPSAAALDVDRKRLAVGGLTVAFAVLLIILGCNGLLPDPYNICPARSAWLEVLIAAVASTVSGQATHRLIKRRE